MVNSLIQPLNYFGEDQDFWDTLCLSREEPL